ncbi:MAG: prepilin-type N-terminal cleavage/methylation domain-containing protein [Planctomycetota bacterium]
MKRHFSHGLTLIEALVAVLIFALVAGALLQVIGQTARSASLLDAPPVGRDDTDRRAASSQTHRPASPWLLRLRRLLEDDLAMATGDPEVTEEAITLSTLSAIDAQGRRVHEPVRVAWRIVRLDTPRQPYEAGRDSTPGHALVRVQRAALASGLGDSGSLDRRDLAAMGIERIEPLERAGEGETRDGTIRVRLHGPAIESSLGGPMILLGPPSAPPHPDDAS